MFKKTIISSMATMEPVAMVGAWMGESDKGIAGLVYGTGVPAMERFRDFRHDV